MSQYSKRSNSSKYSNVSADPENIEPGGVNSINDQTEPEGANLIFFCIIYKGEQEWKSL